MIATAPNSSGAASPTRTLLIQFPPDPQVDLGFAPPNGKSALHQYHKPD
jgi:hypothetical protein